MRIAGSMVMACACAVALWLAPTAAADPPTLSPSSMPDITDTVPTQQSAKVETWTDPTATDDDPSNPTPTVTCSPASGTAFAPGSTQVTCSATDLVTGETGSLTFNVIITVADTTPPAVTVPSDMTVDATSSSGAVVTYTASAVDDVDGPLPVDCGSWPSGSTFPLGSTAVTCSATDTAGNKGSASFTVTVVESQPPPPPPPSSQPPPTISAPQPITVAATGPNGVPATAPVVARFLAGAVASSSAGGAVDVSSDAPTVFPVGKTTVTFKATDSRGKTATASSTVTVTPLASQAALPKTADTTPPDDVSALTGALGNRSVILRWKPPTASDFDHVLIFRGIDKGKAAPVIVYSGAATLFRDPFLRNGVSYRFLVVAVDRAGNKSRGIAVVAKPGAPKLVRPADGASVGTLPRLLWVPFKSASYYNVQLFRGNVKILSVWPGRNSFRLPRQWSYNGKTITLRPGVYHWFVWPGLGKLVARHYGPLLGGATFTVKS